MADFRQVYTKIWSDTWFTKLLPDEKLLFVYLFTNSRASVAGIYELPELFIQFETGLTAEQVGDALKKFQASGKVKYDPQTSVIWVLNMRKYQDSKSPKIASRIAKDFEAIPECSIKKQYAIQYGYSMDTVSIGYPQSADRVSIGYPKNVCDTDTDTDTEMDTDTEKETETETIQKRPTAAAFSRIESASLKNEFDELPEEARLLELYSEITGLTYIASDMQKDAFGWMRQIKSMYSSEERMKADMKMQFQKWQQTKGKTGKFYSPTGIGWLQWVIDGRE